MPRIKMILTLAVLIAISGCATTAAGNKTKTADGNCHEERTREASMQLDMIRQLADQGQFYSALAHLEASGLKSPSAQLLKAESLRRTGNNDQAIKVYDRLVNTCISAYSHLGKGKILAQQGKLNEARQQMQLARTQAPTDANVRNDLGFMLLISGEYHNAQQEFMTAIELNHEHTVARRNLILSLVLSSELDMAWRLAQQHGIDIEEYRDLLHRSANFKRQRTAENMGASQSGSYDKPVLNRLGGTL